MKKPSHQRNGNSNVSVDTDDTDASSTDRSLGNSQGGSKSKRCFFGGGSGRSGRSIPSNPRRATFADPAVMERRHERETDYAHIQQRSQQPNNGDGDDDTRTFFSYVDDDDDTGTNVSSGVFSAHASGTSCLPFYKTGTLKRISDEISGSFEDTFVSLNQVFHAFTLTERDINAVSKRISRAQRQLN